VRLDGLIERSLVRHGEPHVVSGSRAADAARTEVDSVTMDSRAVVPGALFACVPGHVVDGHRFAATAVRAGAVALLSERTLDVAVPQVVVPSVRRVLGLVAGAVYGDPSESMTVVGVTGTNGKTTTVTMLAAVFAAAGWAAAALGTLTQARTTPEAPELQARLAELHRGGQDAVAMEVSSHALDQHRVTGVRFAAGVLTNVTQDHLDYHGTMERYFAAKVRLFEEGRSAVAVVNRDDPWGRRLIEVVRGRGAPPLVSFGIDDAEGLDLRAGTWVWRGQPIALRLGGRFNVYNALAAATCAEALGVPAPAIAAGLGALERVRGRFEAVDAGQDFTVLVDYAHTPDGLAQALGAARELTDGRLIAVFGAGGDRDQDKRPLMGEVVARLADVVILTSDNPRGEDPGAIADQVLSGVGEPGKVRVVADRAEAIGLALRSARPGDVVVVAGKGHETGQEIAGEVRPFDDAAVVREGLGRRLAGRTDRSRTRP
jgi:UDP-N-acetylmuramoyl-L-alanyl-D-glutamate--2,6-diaminopimelate ligase